MIYLVNVSPPSFIISFPIGLGYVAKSLELNQIDFEIIDLNTINPDRREAVFHERISHIRGGIFGFCIMVGNKSMEMTLKYARIVKAVSPSNIVVFGGPLASAIPELLLEKADCDYVVAGEGEERFPELIKSICDGNKKLQVNGVYSKYCKSVKNHACRIEKVKNLDLYSPPMYELFDMKFYTDFA